ncbi:CBP4-domain-containing protein [Patellaria atrata CBS 101060]|uniref:Cytochrome b mRNA-processing protein 4 n=1 Tax=Patellaria atrata CBS 101060 TaxID=1346257 RepID=A0A9P4SBY4_9PEZI|nr:CBP4-domain-containing protein [Patellaria atrata CBS 101060]
MPSPKAWVQMIATGVLLCIGGPAFVSYLTPTEEELFKRYNPELQKRSLENREKRQQDFDSFVTKLKEYSKSDKSIWEAQAEDGEKQRQAAAARAREEQRSLADAVKRRKQEIRDHSRAGSGEW